MYGSNDHHHADSSVADNLQRRLTDDDACPQAQQQALRVARSYCGQRSGRCRLLAWRAQTVKLLLVMAWLDPAISTVLRVELATAGYAKCSD